ncbi:MAG TPA: retropepsin-like aspartic protease [Chthoniobacterales bacterium]
MRPVPTAVLAILSIAAAAAAPEPIAVIPFKREGNLMIVQTRINDSAPLPFILDSGASHSVLTPKLAEALRLKLTPDKPTTGTGKGEVPVLRSDPVKMQLAGLGLEIPAPWIIDLSKVPIPQETAGLIGAELFKRFVVRMDQAARTISVFEPETYRPDGTVPSVPLLVEGDKLFLEATLALGEGKAVTRKLRIDSGSEGSVNDEIVRESSERQRSTLGGGLGENFEGYSGVLGSVKIGPFEFKEVWATGAPHPTIGMELLRRFVVTFDAPHGRLYLEPTNELNDRVPPPGG